MYEAKIKEMTSENEATREGFQAEMAGLQSMIGQMQKGVEERARQVT